ncbi:MAG: Eco57I restriction-modification methylase domain-containing protein [Candidatus Competibacteraceae bacterium]
MDKATAQRLVRNTLKASFDRKRYHGLINELCNGFDDGKAIDNMSVPEAFAAHVKSCQRLGTFTSPEGELADVLVVKLTESWKLERSRTALRDFVAHKLKRDNAYKEAGLIAFVAPDSESWRFSYIRMDYETKRDPDTGKIKTEERLTPARRYSYLVGADEECHTAQTRFLPLLQNTTAKPTLAQLEEAFSVESVTKEFFNEYARLFKATDEALTAVRADLAVRGVSTVDFAKKLLGQVVFLYFIQKKGWLGVGQGQSWGEGPRHFLRQLADQAVAKEQCLFNEVLEPLFYDTLATDRGAEAWCPRFQCRIPFLNGGLFEPLAGYDWEQRAISLPNALFTNQQPTPSGDIGTGILDVFDRYNFTVNEAEPLEKEVAIDPEMLGKVFENLIEENRRKGLGAFYTPREIVHYMCQESLINYLDTTVNAEIPPSPPLSKGGIKSLPRADIEALIREGEQAAHYETARKDGTVSYQRRLPKAIEEQARILDEALRSITVCDPAIGSGAFPVGMMTEIVRARMALTPYFDDATERTAYHFKRHAIQNSLYGVDIDGGAVEIAKLRLWLSLVVDEEDVQQIKPLPNLDYKVVAGNSLLGVEKNLFNDEYFKQLEALKPKFFNESDRAKKAEFRKQIDHLIHQLTKGLEIFDFEIYFSEVFHKKGGFDVVVGNPPYGAEISRVDLVKIKKHVRDTRNSNSAALFTDFAKNRLVHDCGTVSFIVPKSLLFSEDWFSLVRSMLRQTFVLVDVEKAFEKVLLEQVVFVFGRKQNSERYLARKFLDSVFVRQTLIPKKYVEDFEAWICDVSEDEIALAEKMKRRGVRLAQYVVAFRGFPIQRAVKENGHYPVIGGKNLVRYRIRGVKGYVTKTDYAGLSEKINRLAQPKLMAQNIVAHIKNPKPHIQLIVAFDEDGEVLNLDTVTNIVSTNGKFDIKFILALLNSTLTNWYAYKFIFCSAIRTMHFDKYYVGKILIPDVSISEQKIIIRLVDLILAEKKQDAKANTSALEREIDQLVYTLYGLTYDEISLIENSR